MPVNSICIYDNTNVLVLPIHILDFNQALLLAF